MDSSAPLSTPTLCMACSDSSCDFKSVMLQRRLLTPNDVKIDMKFCGVCHTDLHISAGHMAKLQGAIEYDKGGCVAGHELCGIVSEVGFAVSKFKVGDIIGVGCMVDSCGKCGACTHGKEQKCLKQTATYQGDNKNGRAESFPVGTKTLGGYTTVMVVHENFGIHIPETYPIEMAGPVMCAGVTMYSPLKTMGVKPGDKVGIIGLGGLGQMGVRIAVAMGAIVTVISRGEAKQKFAKECGAVGYINSKDLDLVKKSHGSLDHILNTVPTEHDFLAYQPILTKKGKQVLLGLHSGLIAAFLVDAITKGTSRIAGSGIGSIKETQEVIDLCDKNNIYPAIEIIPVTQLNEVFTKLDSNNDEGVRYVLDLATLDKEGIKGGDKAPTLHDGVTPSVKSVIGMFCKLLCCCWWR